MYQPARRHEVIIDSSRRPDMLHKSRTGVCGDLDHTGMAHSIASIQNKFNRRPSYLAGRLTDRRCARVPTWIGVSLMLLAVLGLSSSTGPLVWVIAAFTGVGRVMTAGQRTGGLSMGPQKYCRRHRCPNNPSKRLLRRAVEWDHPVQNVLPPN